MLFFNGKTRPVRGFSYQLYFDTTLSQGVLDIVVKLFVLCQLRAIATRVERITPKLMQQVYQDELKPVHPMLAALRSGDVEEMIKFSDLKLSDTDKKILELRQRVAESAQQTPEEFAYQQLRTDEERRVYMALKDEFDSTLLAPVIRQLFDQNPELTWIGISHPKSVEGHDTGIPTESILDWAGRVAEKL